MTQEMLSPKASPTLSRPLRWLLIGSLAVNLAVAGLAAGVALRVIGPSEPPPPARAAGFGPWAGGLTRDNLKDLREAYRAHEDRPRGTFEADRAAKTALVEALRAQTLSAEALERITADLRARMTHRMEFADLLVIDYIASMSVSERRDFADRLEKSIRPPRKR